MMKEKEIISLNGTTVVEDDVTRKITTTGVKGLDFEKAKELGLFTRISNLLCLVHASIMAAYRIYGSVDYLLSQFEGRKNEIAREMNAFDKSYVRFINFWTDYYAHGGAAKEVNEETEVLFRRIMEWSQLPFEWNLGDAQRTQDNGIDVAIRIRNDENQYTFYKTVIGEEIIGEGDTSWCVTKYDKRLHKQTTVEENMDKASAMMVAKRLSSTDTENIYTASMVHEYMEKKIEITPYKAYEANNAVGSITKVKK